MIDSKDIASLSSDDRANIVEGVYTPLSAAMKILKERRNDFELQRKVDAFFGTVGIPRELVGKQKAVISRCIATPNLEIKYFFEMSELLNLEPQIFEYPGKFVNINTDKYMLSKMHFLTKREGHSLISEKKSVIDFNASEGKMFKEIATVTGEPIIDLHHRLFEVQYPDKYSSISDFTDWFDATKNYNDEYYFCFFSLFIVNGVLFENYFSQDDREYSFFCEKIYGSFKKVEEYFGVKPLIVPLLPLRGELAKEWLWYDIDIKDLI